MLFIKKCSNCNHKSYSSSNKGDWVCPYCLTMITLEQGTEKNDKIALPK